MPASRLILVLSRSAQQEADLQTYLESVQDKNSSNYHKFLAPDEFGKRFGVADADLQAVQTWLNNQGFSVAHVGKARMSLEFSGTVGQVETAFHTSIHSYSVAGKLYWGNASDPAIPAALAPVVAGVASLSSFKPAPQYIRGPSGVYDPSTHTINPTYTLGNTTTGYYIFLGPADAATIYDTPTALNANYSGTKYDGSGVTIGIAGDSNISIAQNANYRATFGLSSKATTVVVDGADPGENGDAIEAYLDTQVAGGIAPNANIILYTAADTGYQSGLFLAIARALDDNQADILNVSFGACESAIGSAGNQYINDLWEQAAAQGITVTVSSGDSGSAGCDNPNTETAATHGIGVNGIASTPYNVAVGGTDFDALYSNFPTSFTNYVDTSNTYANHRSALKYIPEEPWNDSTFPNTSISQNVPISVASHYQSSDNIIAGGGGPSTVYTAPNWQSALATGSTRSLPDVSFLAGNGFYGALWGLCTDQDYDPSTSSYLTDCAGNPTTGANFNLTGVGGTSAAAPAFAGMLALLKQKAGTRLGQVDYALYAIAKSKYATVFHDVTTGDNSVECVNGTANCAAVNLVNTYYLNGFNAATGYDMASGLGSVDASQMIANWASAALTTTTTSLQLNGATTPLSITHGQSVTVNATVAGSGGTPGGQVALVDNLSPASFPNNEALGDFTLSGGAVNGTTTDLPGGTYAVSAHYGGSTAFAQSDSNAIQVTVAPETSSTSLTVQGYYDPSTGKKATTPYYGYIYLLDAQPYGNSASATNPNGIATGTVTFKNGAATLGTATLSSQGIAELQTSTLPGGSNSLTASFPGDASFAASTSTPVALTIVPATTTLNGPSFPQGSAVPAGSQVTFSVTLTTDSAGAAPTGTVTFTNGSTTIGTATLSGTAATSTGPASGSATYSTSSLLPGDYNVSAAYSGDSNYAPSTAGPASLTILKTSTNVTMTPSTTSLAENQPLQVTVTPSTVGTLAQPTGSVTLSYLGISGSGSQTANLANGTVVFTIPANTLALGSQFLIASYSGDSLYFSSSATVQISVKSSGTIAPTITIAAPTSTVNLPVSVTVNITGPSGDPTPTGSVTLTSSAYFQSTEPLVNGAATFTMAGGLNGGANTLTASYLGDSNYTSGTGSGTVTLFQTPQISFAPWSPTVPANQPLTTVVTVTGNANGGTATGTVTLSSGSYQSSAVALTGGSASITIPASTLPTGTDLITASYSGDSAFDPGINTEYATVTAPVPASFSLSGSAVSIAPGATTGNTSTITVTPAGGFTGSVSLSAALTGSPAGAIDPPTVSFGATSPVSLNGSSAATATMTVTTTPASTGALRRSAHPGARWLDGGAVLACILLFGIPSKRRRWQTLLGLVVLLASLTTGLISCGGGGSSGGGGGGGNTGTTAGTYTFTITGTSNPAITPAPTATVTVTVQ